MDKSKFLELRDKGEKFYLYFFSPFCGVCETTDPLLIKAKHPLFKIVGFENEELMDALGIEDYPTIVEFQKKSYRLYEGRIAIENLLNG